MDLVPLSVGGRASDVDLEEAESFSSVGVTLVVRVPRAFITSLKVGSDLFSDERRSVSGWALLLVLIDSPSLIGLGVTVS